MLITHDGDRAPGVMLQALARRGNSIHRACMLLRASGWKQIVENYEDTKDIANQKYYILSNELSSFKQLPNENAHDMYSRLNTIVNEINALGLNQVKDEDINRSDTPVILTRSFHHHPHLPF